MRLTSPPKVYPSVGRCIYCGAVNSDLRREHIIPFGLGGNLVLPRASCRACEALTGKIEQACLRGILGHFRIRHGFPTRRKKERPSTLPVQLVSANGDITIQQVPIKEYPPPPASF
jgi:HNH endonuclease